MAIRDLGVPARRLQTRSLMLAFPNGAKTGFDHEL
jgi:hypothetical protein